MEGNRNYFTEKDVKRLEEQAVEIRRDIISMITKAKAGHPGGSLSAADMVTALYFHGRRLCVARKCAQRRTDGESAVRN